MQPTSGKTAKGPAAHQPPAPTLSANPIRTTRSSSLATTQLREEPLSTEDYTVKDAISGEKYLREKLLIQEGETIYAQHLITALHHITQLDKVPLPAREAIKAVAYLLQSEVEVEVSSTLVSALHDGLAKAVSKNVITSISTHVANLMEANEALSTNVERLQTLQTTQEAIGKSYSDAVCSHALPNQNRPPHTSTPTPATIALGRATVKERQILVDPLKGQTLHKDGQPTQEIVDQFQNVLNIVHALRKPDIPIPTIKAVTKLKNGGIILELDSDASAQWIRDKEIKKLFTDSIGTPVDIKDRTYTIMVPFLPIRFPIADDSWLRAIETENNLTEGTITAAKWIKQISKRNENQRVAHALFSLTNPFAANNLLRDGLYVCKEKLHPKKERREPIRCVRCQGWGHIAKECKASHDICAKCGFNHRTDECDAPPKDKYCINCSDTSHPSNDLACPVYLNKRAEMDAKFPENSMPYFPTNEPWTQVLLPPQPPPIPRPPPKMNRGHPPPHPSQAYRQTTLDSYPQAPPNQPRQNAVGNHPRNTSPPLRGRGRRN